MITASITAILFVAAYLAPTAVALARRHPAAALIAGLNALAGVTVIGWIMALAWALAPLKDPGRPIPA